MCFETRPWWYDTGPVDDNDSLYWAKQKKVAIHRCSKKKTSFLRSLYWYWCKFALRPTRPRLCVGVRAYVVFAFATIGQPLVDVSKIKKTKTGICFCLSPLSCSCSVVEFVFRGYHSLLLFLCRSTNVSTTKLHWCTGSSSLQPFRFQLSPPGLRHCWTLNGYVIDCSCGGVYYFCGECLHHRLVYYLLPTLNTYTDLLLGRWTSQALLCFKSGRTTTIRTDDEVG